MNGIAPFWSGKSLIGFLVAPVSAGLLAGLLTMFNLPAGGVNVSAVLFVLMLSILGAAIVGYPIALLTAAPLYYFVFRRMTRVRYRHFLIYGLTLAVLFGLAAKSGLIMDGPNSGEDSRFAAAVIVFGIFTVFACSVFYLIVRQPENIGTDADTADDHIRKRQFPGNGRERRSHMNGIAPFWSVKTLLAFAIAPISFGLVFAMPIGLLLGGSFAAGFFVILVSARVGYPIALLAGIPTYLIFRRLKKVTLTHFLVYGPLVSLIAGLGGDSGFRLWLMAWIGQRADLYAMLSGQHVMELIKAQLLLLFPTIFSCAVFWYIVRVPKAPSNAADKLDT